MPEFDQFIGTPVPGLPAGRIQNPRVAARMDPVNTVTGAASIYSYILSNPATAKSFLQGSAVLFPTAPATTSSITRTGGALPVKQLDGMSWNDVVFAVRNSAYTVA